MRAPVMASLVSPSCVTQAAAALSNGSAVTWVLASRCASAMTACTSATDKKTSANHISAQHMLDSTARPRYCAPVDEFFDGVDEALAKEPSPRGSDTASLLALARELVQALEPEALLPAVTDAIRRVTSA